LAGGAGSFSPRTISINCRIANEFFILPPSS
jgi:hypothetical protein